MEHLILTNETNPVSPNSGLPYVFYNPNPDVENVWIYLGVQWILSDGDWIMEKSWDNDGIWKYYGEEIQGDEITDNL